MIRPIVLTGFALLLPMIAQGQGRTAVSAGPHAMAMAPRPMMRAGQPVAAHAPWVSRMAVRAGTTRTQATRPARRVMQRPSGAQRQFDMNGMENGGDFIPVPGLGFDIPHLAAIGGPEAVGARRHGDQFPFFLPFFDGEFFIPSTLGVVEEAQAPVAQPAEDTASEASETSRRARDYQPAPAPAVETASAAPRETNEYVFVRRDGTVFFAIAYAWENGTLRYITHEGLRRSVAKDVLDLDATQQFNEQRGLNFRLPV